jgi:hypothetical protein
MKIFSKAPEWWKERSPLTIVELIIAVFTVIGGLYVMSPLVVVDVSITHFASVANFIAGQAGLILLGVAAVFSGMATIVGVCRRNYRMRSAGMFSNILLRVYAFTASLIFFAPISINFTAITLLAICVVCWLNVRSMVFREDNHK